MRPTKPPRLYLRDARKARRAIWIIVDGRKESSAQALALASAARLRSRSRTICSKTDDQPSATVIPIKS